MEFKHVLVAIHDSDAGRNAARFAAQLAVDLGAELTVLTVFPSISTSSESSGELDRVQRMLGREIVARHPSLALELAVARGVPQVEIPRFAERVKADLIVLGRKPRSRAARVILGDTADAVVRRSRLPTLLVPPGLTSPRRVLVALDGSDRGAVVLRVAALLARSANLEFNAVTVEPAGSGAPIMVSTRSERLASRVEESFECGRKLSGNLSTLTLEPLHVRWGDTVQEILTEVGAVKADILVTGFHPGGPVLMIEERSVSRKLLHASPSAVLTVPL